MRRRAGVGLVIAVLAVLWWWHGSRETKVPEAASKAAITAVSRDSRAQAKNATLSGRVTRAKDGAPISDAVIAIEQQRMAYFRSPPIYVSSKGDGAWVTPIVAGDYQVSVVADGYLPNVRAHVEVTGTTTLEVALVDGGILVHGFVSDVGGGPVAGARVSTFEDRLRVVTFSRADGSFRFTLEPDTYQLRVEHDDYTMATAEVFVASGPVVHDFSLVPCGSIRGTVVTRDSGKPVPDALVTIGVYAWDQSTTATSDADGKFTLHHVSAGPTSLYARSKHYVTYNGTDVNVGIGETQEVKLFVEPAYTIRGRVVRANEPSTGIEDVSVNAHTNGAAPDNQLLGNTSGDGAFEITGLAPSTYQLTATGRSIQRVAKIVKLDRDLDGIVMMASSGTTLTGRIDPPTRAALSFSSTGFRDDSLATWQIDTEVSDDGSFIARNVPAGDLTAYARTRDRSGTLDLHVGTSAQSSLVIKLSPKPQVWISGTVVDDGGPVANAIVMTDSDMTTSASDGTFSIPAGGTTNLRAACGHSDLGFGRAPLATVEVHKDVRDIVLHIAPCRDQITGRVVGANGAPRADVWVRAGNESPALTGADGVFTVGGLRAGSYDVTATSSSGDETVTKTAVRTGDHVTLELREIPTLDGTVTMNGQPVTDFEVTCEGYQRHVTSPDGKFQIAHYDVSGQRAPTCAAAALEGEGSATVVSANGSMTATIVLQPFVSVRGTILNALTKRPLTGVAISADGDVAAGLNRAGAPYPVDGSGQFQIDQLSAGEHRLRVVPGDGWGYLAMLPVHATAGASIDLGTKFVIPPSSGRLGIAGIVLDENLIVQALLPASPATHIDVRIGDKITKLDGISVSDLDNGSVQRLLSNGAPYGENLILELARGVTVNVTAE